MLNFGKRRRRTVSDHQRPRQNPAQPASAKRTDDRASQPSKRPTTSVRPLRVTPERRSTEPRESARPPIQSNAQPKKRPAEKRSSETPRRKSRPFWGTTEATAAASRRAAKPSLSSSMLALLYGTRLMIMGIGVGVIAGTALSVWDPANRVTADSSTKPQPQQSASPKPSTPTLELTQELTPLKSELQRLMAQSPDLSAGLMVVDLDNGEFLDFNAGNVIPAASTIKFPLLVAFFQDVDAGKIRLDEMLTMRKDLIATEAGDLQDQPPGSQFSALEVASKMITISDNTATNMILDRLGGKAAVNQRFQSWGLAQTQIGDWLPDLKGTNTTSPKDMATLLGVVTKGQLVSLRSLDLMLQMMRSVENTAMLPQGLGQGAKIAHKTGNIGSVVGDVGLVDMPSGKRYLITALVKRPHGDERAISLVQQLSKTTYQYFDRASGKPVSAPGGLPPARPDGIAAPTTPLPSPTDSQGAAPLPKTKIAQP